MLLGCIGDDFTGSSDLANTLARQGMAVTQYCGIPDGPADPAVEAGVIALKSRTIPVAEAVDRALAALAWLRAQGCRQFLFKYCSTFDSTPDGNIGPVAAALAEALDAQHVIVCPAFPATGRRVFQGHLFVQDRLLSESGMQHHPLTPMTDPDLRRWLARQTTMPVGFVGHDTLRQGVEPLKSALQGTGRLIVCDAICDDDLLTLGAAAADFPLLTGGSGIALGLPANFRARGLLADRPSRWSGSDGRAVVLSGSCSVATRGQVAAHTGEFALELTAEALFADRLDPRQLAAQALAAPGLPLIYSSADPDAVRAAQERWGGAEVAARFESLFAAIARELVAAGVTRLIVAGGETSGAVVEGLTLGQLDIGPEIAPGVPALRSGDLTLALKSGNFGGPDFFAHAANVLGGVDV